MQANGPNGGKTTASRQTRIAQCITGPSTRATQLVEDVDHEQEQGLALFATHGAADAASTIYATQAVGAQTEANPIMAQLLHVDPTLAAITMLAVVGAVSISYPRFARACEFPTRWFGVGLAIAGLLVAIINVVVGVTA
ncbi:MULTISPECIES: DUF5658 family protein [Halolamina]|uniref:DUF5658 domain-containing protein n=1 Tax=Halolamina pelagica TaxID=699431 RepID=A0A1I5VNW4_9EURY|nr:MULTISPECIES: DUF5658 family protein [Halolamina]NHX37842.1 hypothetical protein [Halolamina sp. R1-12]SFQ09131.1 hypothetical protein SAMN05216277_11910 [Halolamina pelagica]